eukprot:GGOE01009659.1.p5 GENE.GGOE01009659.1~~GGOE01009659.1.p5  ORF type:complete len:130 (+),score=3.39 GGOE01009659.1:209-598(+)
MEKVPGPVGGEEPESRHVPADRRELLFSPNWQTKLGPSRCREGKGEMEEVRCKARRRKGAGKHSGLYSATIDTGGRADHRRPKAWGRNGVAFADLQNTWCKCLHGVKRRGGRARRGCRSPSSSAPEERE